MALKASYLLILVVLVDIVLGSYLTAISEMGYTTIDYDSTISGSIFDSSNNGSTAILNSAGETALFDPLSQTDIAEESANDYYSQQGNKVSGLLDYLADFTLPVGSMLRTFEAPSIFSYIADTIWVLLSGFALWSVFWRWDI